MSVYMEVARNSNHDSCRGPSTFQIVEPFSMACISVLIEDPDPSRFTRNMDRSSYRKFKIQPVVRSSPYLLGDKEQGLAHS